MNELSSTGCVDFLRRLRVEVCDTGDSIIHAGTLQSQFYILMRGELQLSLSDSSMSPSDRGSSGSVLGDATADGRNRWQLLKDSTLSQQRVRHNKNSMRDLTGRVDKPGSLLGFSDVFDEPQPMLYSVRAFVRSSFYAISRDDLRRVLELHEHDRSVFQQAIDHTEQLYSLSAMSIVGNADNASGSQQSNVGGTGNAPRRRKGVRSDQDRKATIMPAGSCGDGPRSRMSVLPVASMKSNRLPASSLNAAAADARVLDELRIEMASESRKAAEMRENLTELSETVHQQQRMIAAIASHLGVDVSSKMKSSPVMSSEERFGA